MIFYKKTRSNWGSKYHHNFEPASMADPAPIENTPYKGSRGGSRGGRGGSRGAPVGAVGGFYAKNYIRSMK